MQSDAALEGTIHDQHVGCHGIGAVSGAALCENELTGLVET